jgi:hypothetical protein
MKRYHRAMAVALMMLVGATAEAQGPRYQPLQLDCVRYQTEAQAMIVLEAGKERSREGTGRAGIMVIRGSRTAGDSLLQLEAWFESLVLYRESNGERLEPDTDGLIGGRFRASLAPTGAMLSTELPFFPDDVAQVTDLSGALTSLLPQLPPQALAPGTGWRDDLGTVITRLGDITLGGRRVERYRLSRKSVRPVEQMLPDSSVVTASRNESEEGTFYWATELGLVRWERDLTDELLVEKGGVVKQPFRTRIEQKVTVERVSGGACS